MNDYKVIVKMIIVTFYIMMMCIMFMQVVLRYIFNSPTMWAEEASRYLFIWICYLGAAMAISKKLHIGVDYFIKYISSSLQRKIFYVTNGLTILMLLFVLIQGIKMTFITMAFPAHSMEFLPQGFAFLAIPAGAFLMMIGITEAIFEKIKNKEPFLSQEVSSTPVE
jgi:TRAP-type C4-dicarboxylate transport system permease small subunit